MANHRKSLEELALSGTLQRNPGKYKARIAADEAKNAQSAKDSAESLPLGNPPAWLDSDHKKVWRELARSYPNLTQKDRTFLEVAVKLSYRMRTATLKSQETTQLLSILARFDGVAAVTVTSAPNNPDVDNRTPQEKSWDEFIAMSAEMDRRDKLVAAEVERRKQTTPPDHLTETQKNHWTHWHDVRMDLFEDERESNRKMHEQNDAFIAKMRAEGKWTDNKPKQEEKTEYTPPPRPVAEPFVEDPAKKQERMQMKWSM